ncbi:MAG: hypothetical protein ACERKD_07115 [Prolixibacteraceae bacterium]
MIKKRHLKKLSLVFLIGFMVFDVWGQGTVKGYIRDEFGKPIAGATVAVKGTTIMTLSDEYGVYELLTSFKSCSISISYNGKSKTLPVLFDNNQVVVLNPVLSIRKGVEKNLFGLQVGTGLNIYNEKRLTKDETWRIQLEATLIPVFLNYDAYEYSTSGLLLYPFNVSSELRSYFNLEKRSSMNKKTQGNAGNYFSLALRYCPGSTILNDFNLDYSRGTNNLPDIWLIYPSLGFRRTIGNSFNVEFMVGAGTNIVDFKIISYGNNFEPISAQWLNVIAGYASLKFGWNLISH